MRLELQQSTGRSSSLPTGVERGREAQGTPTPTGTELVFATVDLHGCVSMENGASRNILSGNTANIKGQAWLACPQLWNQVWLPPLLTEESLKEPFWDKHEELQWGPKSDHFRGTDFPSGL